MICFLTGGVAACVLLLSASAAEPESIKPSTAATERQLLALTREWVDAETNRDEATLRRILDDRCIATFGAGQPVDKEAYVKAIMTDGPQKMLGHTLTDETILVAGDTAILVGTDAILSLRDGKESTQSYRYTVTWLKREGRWTVLALHMVRMPAAK